MHTVCSHLHTVFSHLHAVFSQQHTVFSHLRLDSFASKHARVQICKHAHCVFAPELQHPLIAGIRALGPLQVCRQADCVCVFVCVCVCVCLCVCDIVCVGSGARERVHTHI